MVTMNNSFDATEYIGQVLGPEISLPISWMLLLTSVYVVIFLMGTIGNILVVIVILKFRFMRENITNLYLCNLAVTDLLSITAGQFFSTITSSISHTLSPHCIQISLSFTATERIEFLQLNSNHSVGLSKG